VPAGKTLRVTIAGDLTYDVVAVIASACPDIEASCRAAADDGFAGDSETVAALNGGSAAATFFVVADGYGSTDVGSFTITVEIL